MTVSQCNAALLSDRAVVRVTGPATRTFLQGLITNGMRFGNRPFKFSASSRPLYGPFVALWLSSAGLSRLPI